MTEIEIKSCLIVGGKVYLLSSWQTVAAFFMKQETRGKAGIKWFLIWSPWTQKKSGNLSKKRGIGWALTHSCNLRFKAHFKCIIPELLSFVTQLLMIRPSDGQLWLSKSVFYPPLCQWLRRGKREHLFWGEGCCTSAIHEMQLHCRNIPMHTKQVLSTTRDYSDPMALNFWMSLRGYGCYSSSKDAWFLFQKTES